MPLFENLVAPLLRWMRLMKPQQWIDVLVDIDDTLVYGRQRGTLKASGYLGSYRLAHRALEFLIALDRIPGVRIGFYSCGAKLRNEQLIRDIVAAMEAKGYRARQKFAVFSVAAGAYGKKRLDGLRQGMDLSRTILVDDSGKNIATGEEANLLKIYKKKRFADELTDAQKVYKARVASNLVRALGLILKTLELSAAGSMTVVQALESLQWDGDLYLHQQSNAEEIYKLGLQAMQLDFSFTGFDDPTSVFPWSSLQSDADTQLFPQQRNLIIPSSVLCR